MRPHKATVELAGLHPLSEFTEKFRSAVWRQRRRRAWRGFALVVEFAPRWILHGPLSDEQPLTVHPRRTKKKGVTTQDINKYIILPSERGRHLSPALAKFNFHFFLVSQLSCAAECKFPAARETRRLIFQSSETYDVHCALFLCLGPLSCCLLLCRQAPVSLFLLLPGKQLWPERVRQEKMGCSTQAIAYCFSRDILVHHILRRCNCHLT